MFARNRAKGLAAGLLALGLFACRPSASLQNQAVGIVGPGVVNDPTNKSLRFDMIRFALGEFCSEMLTTGTPIRLSDDQPVLGRFFAESCEARGLDMSERRSIAVKFSGRGYVYSAATGRLGFSAGALLELAPDFRSHNAGLYVYFRAVQTDTSRFEVQLVEHPLTQATLDAAHVNMSEIGQKILRAQLGRGFTVIRANADGQTEFAMGLIKPGERPFRPFIVESSSLRTWANGRTEIFPGQQDFLGRIRVSEGEGIVLRAQLDGERAIDLALITASEGESVTATYTKQKGPVALSSPVWQAQLGSGAPLKGIMPVPPGEYFLVLDHSGATGAVRPEAQAMPARIDYLVQVGLLDRGNSGASQK